MVYAPLVSRVPPVFASTHEYVMLSSSIYTFGSPEAVTLVA
jgi:hypothetical protein